MDALQPNYQSTPDGECQPFQGNVRKFTGGAGCIAEYQPAAGAVAGGYNPVMRTGMDPGLRNVAIAQMADSLCGDRVLW